ncbi:MAG: HAD-IC family P-type ATPase [Actinomycetota bacterium]|nr:HAD-IC family P-type ATPase [Actinomycetota bacterium]
MTVVGTRPERSVRQPNVLLLDGLPALTDGFELARVLPLTETHNVADLLARAGGISGAAGSPWGNIFPIGGSFHGTDGSFDGKVATALLEGVRYSLGPIDESDSVPGATSLSDQADYALLLCGERDERPIGMLTLRPRLNPGVTDLTDVCRHHGVEIAVLTAHDTILAHAVARRAGVPLVIGEDAPVFIRMRQAEGSLVAFASHRGDAGAAFAACDLAIGVVARGGSMTARADLVAPDLSAVAKIVATGARREAVVRDSVILSMAANGIGAVWGLRSGPGIGRASFTMYIAALGALTSGWARTRGGRSPHYSKLWIEDPHPERWGRQGIESVLRAFDATEVGLTGAQAAERRRSVRPMAKRNRLITAVLDQIYSPLTGILAAGAGLSLILGAPADVVMIGAMIVANAAAGAWQESRANQAAEALDRMGAATAQVLRDGRSVAVSASDVVPGDVLLLTPGDRVVADARLLEAHGLEVDEAALTGESLPVAKTADGQTDGARVVLEGSDVTVGTGRAVVVAVGSDTRLGATAAALVLDDMGQSPLGTRLNRMLGQVLPIAAVGGSIVAVSGLARGLAPLPQLAVGASIAIAAVPEGLPLLAKIGEAAVARRLAHRHALVHRLAAVEALGRVDVVCTDKTGTLTEGRLKLSLVAALDEEAPPSTKLTAQLRTVLLTAALAGPHPDALDASTDRTDVAVIEGARAGGMSGELGLPRDAHSPFDAARALHAAVVQGRLCVEGAAEALIPRCDRVRRGGVEVALDEIGRSDLLARAEALAVDGLRVLMVAEGSPGGPTNDPNGLVALGFLGISDPLRPSVAAAVRRCHDAGVRVIMLTGDHPATAQAIARDAGLRNDGDVLTGPEIGGLGDLELDQRLERVGVIARASALDKLRIVEGLQRLGHSVAMTGDGINDAPALRLADVGVAMGRGGTEVARQAADVVLVDDDFATLVEAFVEGRSFWRNIRRALGLLLGGNLGELALQVGTSVLGLASPLTSRQILAVNLITDVLPALAVALQQPEHHTLAGLAREGTEALDAPLRADILRRAAATAGPTFAAYAIALRSGSMPVARTVAFASIVTTQLTQTLDVGRGEGGLSRTVLGAVAGAAGLLAATVVVAPLRGFLGLAMPTPVGLALVGAASLAAVLLSRRRALPWLAGLGRALAPARRLGAPHEVLTSVG